MASNGTSRRPPATVSNSLLQASVSVSATSTRAHRSNDSHHGFVGSHPAIAGPAGFSPVTAADAPQSRAVLALIQRLKAKLPCYSGIALTDLEADSAVQNIIETLVELAKHALDIIVWKLSQELESLAKLEATGQRAIFLLQSELFLLKVMTVTLSRRWQHRDATQKAPKLGDTTIDLREGASSPAPSSTFFSQSQSSKPSQTGTKFSTPSLSLEASPLDEKCARWLVSVMILLLRQAAPRDDRTKMYDNLSPDASLYGFESLSTEAGLRHESDVLWLPSSDNDFSSTPTAAEGQWPHKTPSLTSVSSTASSPIPLARSMLGFQHTPRTLTMASSPLYSLITEWAGNIVYLLSAANWNAVFGKIRGKVHSLARASQEDSQDYTDLQLMQHCALDRTRLIVILQDLSSLLVNMKSDAQCAVAIHLRQAIWNWIETFPSEFIEMASGHRKLDGAPERVFDLFVQIEDDQNKRTLWPTMTALLILSHDRLKQVALLFESHTRNKQSQNKKELVFLDKIQKNTSAASKLSETSLLCQADVMRSATYIPVEHDVTLRSVALEVAHSMKARTRLERLWKAQDERPFFESSDPIDVSLYADVIAGITRLLPEDEYLRLIYQCLEPDRSDAVKLVALKAVITLSYQASKWSHLEPVTTEHLVDRIRRLYQSSVALYTERDQLGVMKRSAAKPNMKRFSSEAFSEKELLILAILCLYRIDALFFPILQTAPDSREWFEDICVLVRDPGRTLLPLASLRAYTSQAEWMLGHAPGTRYHESVTFWLGLTVPIILHIAAVRLLDTRESVFEQRMIAEMLYYFIVLYRKGVENDVMGSWDFSRGRLPSVVIAEIAFLVTLTSTDTVVSSLAAKGLREIATAECLPNSRRPFEESDEAAKRYPVYEQLGDPSVLVVGRVAQQKRIRKLLRLLNAPSPLHAAVWHECYSRWAALRDWILNRPQAVSEFDVHSTFRPAGDLSMSTEEKFYQWQNLTLFMASFGAVSVMEDLTSDLVKMFPTHELPDRVRILQDGNFMLQDFIASTVEFLVSDVPLARDTAKEALGSELSPRLFSRLFKQLYETVDDVARTASDPSGIPAEEELLLLFFEQLVTVLKILVDRVDAPSDDFLANSDLSQTLLTLTKFMERFRDGDLLRFKTKFCMFCEVACGRADSFGLRTDDFIRNNLLNIIVEWFEPEGAGHDDFHLMRLRHEANVAALRTVVRLLERLRLQPVDVSSGDDVAHVVSRRYLRYQTILLHGLQLDPLTEPSIDEDRSSQHSAGQRKCNSEKGGLRDLIISGLAHLLSMNTDIGLKHFLPLGYDSDPPKRAIFCRVISRVMDLGGRLETQNDSMIAGRRSRIGELVKGCDMILVLAICETCPPSEVDVITPVLLNLFDSRASLLELLKLMIEREVKTTQNEVNLFRGNSMRIKLLCAFAKIHGYDYLRRLVKPLLDMMSQGKHETSSFILDPAKTTEEDVENNRKTIKILAENFLTIVCDSASTMPLLLREACAYISQTVADVWPEAKFAALGAFIFLRFISPALVSPETIDIELPTDHIRIRRGLLVITKIIQNLANNVRFGKEAHMMFFNDFLSDNIVRVMRFLTDVNKIPSAAEEDPGEWQGGTFDETDAIVLHRFFEKHADKVGKELLSLSKTSKEGEAAVVGGKKAWDTLCAALVEMGQPVEVPRLSPLHSSAPGVFQDFILRNSERNTESVMSLFSEVAVKEDVVLYLFPISQLDVEVLDFELLVYHIFKTLMVAAHDGKPIELIVDCTNYTTASEIPMQWFKFFIELIPSDLRSRFNAVHVLNCNLPMQRFLRKLYNICSGIFFVEIRPKFSVADVCEAVRCDVSDALKTAYNLEQEDKEIFTDVMLRQAHLMKVPVNLAVALSHLRIDSVKPQNVFAQFSCKTTEIVPFGDIGDIYNVSTGRDANEFIIRRNRNGGTLYFSSQERDHIVKTIRSAKSRMNVSRAIFFDRFSRLSNVTAALLNIGMINVHHDHPDLRSSAYDLLRAVCASISYDTESMLPSSGGLIPGNPMMLILQLSERLALFAPELTLDFLSQACLELEKSNVPQKAICLRYVTPWIRNLNKFCDPTSDLYELSGARMRDCVRLLLDMTVRDPETCYMTIRLIWPEVGRLDTPVVNIVLDEIMRAAVDGGLGSTRCDVMAEVLAHMCSRSARGRILAKLRKALGKTSTKPSKTLDKNIHWNEITAYSRLALGTGYSPEHALQIQLLVPEILHLVTLLASQGEASMRNTIYGLTLQLFQALYHMNTEDLTLASEIRSLVNELSQPEVVRLFGLARSSNASEYLPTDNYDSRESLEGLTQWLLKALAISAGNAGLTNVWRARWMGLLTATAFQLSPSIQPRAFVVMGSLSSSDVDDDLLYQMLVALRSAMKMADESDTDCVVSMLNCIRKVVPSLPRSSRYISTLFWLAVALLQSSHAHFYKDANDLLCACITTLREQDAFQERGFTGTLLEARSCLEDIQMQLDELLGLSFVSDFSFSLAAVIFKGIRRPNLRQSAMNALRCLLTTAMSTIPPSTLSDTPVHNEVLGYFLALLAVSTTPSSYEQLLLDAQVGDDWIPDEESFERSENSNDELPRVRFGMLGCREPTSALLAISFLGAILSSAQVDGAESQMLFSILKDASMVYPEVVSLAYDGLQDKIHDIFTTSSNPSVLTSASVLFRVAMEDTSNLGSGMTKTGSGTGSSTTLSTLDEDVAYGKRQQHALEELNMQGLVNTFQFLPLNRGHVTKVLNWFPELITKIIE